MVWRASRAGTGGSGQRRKCPGDLALEFGRLTVADESRPRKLHPRLDRQLPGFARQRSAERRRGGAGAEKQRIRTLHFLAIVSGIQCCLFKLVVEPWSQ